MIYWTNAIKPLVLMRDVYNGGSGTPNHPDSDVRNFLDYMVADPNCVTEGGYNGSDYFRSELHRPGQWANIKAATIGFRSNIVNNIVIDDARATLVGNWTTVKTFDATVGTIVFTGETPGDTNSFGTNYWRKAQGTGADYMEYTPTIIKPGNYDLYEWHPTRADASAGVPFVVNHAAGTTTNFVNQQTNGGDWTLIGRYFFNAGTNGTIRILDNFSEVDRVATVDGLKMVFVPILPGTPNNLQATTVNSSQISLRWNDNSTNELNFIIARSTLPGGPYFDIASTAANVTNFTDSGLLDSTIYYYVVRSRAYNVDSVDSNEGSALTAAGPPTIITQPTNQIAMEGQSATFSVEAISSSFITYQWQFENEEIPGATDSSYTVSNITASANAGEYSVVVGNQVGSMVSASALLTVNFSLAALVNPESGGTVAISPSQAAGYTTSDIATLTATANPGFVFVGWSQDAVSASNPIDVAMTGSKTLVANFLQTDDIIVDNPDADYTGVWTIGSSAGDKFGSYYQYATTSGGTANAIYTPNILTSGKYNVSVWYPQGTNRTTQAQVLIAFDGDAEGFSVDQTTGGGTWQTVATGKPFAAGTSGFVSIGNNTGENNKIVIADAVRFSFNPAPVIFSQPQPQIVKVSSNATFQVLAASTSPFTYQWQFNGVDLPGATTSSYTRTNAQLEDAGNYSVILSNQIDVVASDAALLNVSFVIPATLNSVSVHPETGFHFSLSGAANTIYTIETSTNLVDWVALTNIFSPDGNLEFTDPTMNGDSRFYRARWSPE